MKEPRAQKFAESRGTSLRSLLSRERLVAIGECGIMGWDSITEEDYIVGDGAVQ